MRAIFTLEIPKDSANSFLTDDKFLSLIRNQGWDDNSFKDLNDAEKLLKYKEKAENLWSLMPEVANQEKKYLIFCGRLQDSQTDFLITRENEGFVKFRLIQPKLDKLQDSTEKILKILLKQSTEYTKTPILKIANDYVEILEKGETYEIIEGRIIINAFKESKLVNNKNYAIAISTGIAFIIVLGIIFMFALYEIDHKSFWYESLERLNTVLLTTCIVSAFDFYQTYRNIKEHSLIAWTVATDLKKEAKKLFGKK